MGEGYVVVPLSPMRKVIAARMTEAARTIPHFRLVADLNVDALLGLRRRLRDSRPDERVSLNDLMIKACSLALQETPAVNIQWVEGVIHQYSAVDISVVTAVDGGLSTPIVRGVQAKSVFDVAREVKELAARAASNSLRMNEILGGTFSISNLGMYGIDQFDAIINPPQCAILAVGRAKPALIGETAGESRVAMVMRVTLSIDHRALDGAIGAEFLSALRRHVEQPDQISG
jgi:pyruvate dehydrogenase E2 component (dihydrolipoamide acetyltransferase)